MYLLALKGAFGTNTKTSIHLCNRYKMTEFKINSIPIAVRLHKKKSGKSL